MRVRPLGPGSLALALLALGGCGSQHVCIVVTTDPAGAEVRLGEESRIVATSPTEPFDVELPEGDPTVVLTVTKLDHTVGRKVITMARPHDSAAEARQDIQRFHFELHPTRR